MNVFVSGCCSFATIQRRAVIGCQRSAFAAGFYNVVNHVTLFVFVLKCEPSSAFWYNLATYESH